MKDILNQSVLRTIPNGRATRKRFAYMPRAVIGRVLNGDSPAVETPGQTPHIDDIARFSTMRIVPGSETPLEYTDVSDWRIDAV
jgi:hypothetical protein